MIVVEETVKSIRLASSSSRCHTRDTGSMSYCTVHCCCLAEVSVEEPVVLRMVVAESYRCETAPAQ